MKGNALFRCLILWIKGSNPKRFHNGIRSVGSQGPFIASGNMGKAEEKCQRWHCALCGISTFSWFLRPFFRSELNWIYRGFISAIALFAFIYEQECHLSLLHLISVVLERCVDSPGPFQKWLPPHVVDHASALYIDFKVLITITVQMSDLLKTVIPTPTFNSPNISYFHWKFKDSLTF